MVVVKFLNTSSGSYGLRKRGQTAEVHASIAKVLEKEGIARVVTEDDGEEPAEKAISGGVRITDVTGNIQSADQGKIIKQETVIKPEEPTPNKDVPHETDLDKEKAEKPKPEPAETKKKEYK